MASDLLKITKRFLIDQQLLDRPLLLGFSGGADSMALLLTLNQLDQTLTAVHFQHGLRGKAAEAEALWCERFCAGRRIPFLCRNLQVPQQKLSGETVEEAARRLRLQAWEELCEQGQIPVFLAHHADDCLEELLLRLARGANASGLTGLREIRRIGKVLLCRPFLELRKIELEEFLLAQGIKHWCRDLSNLENRFRRNAMRNLILPELRSIFHSDAGLLQARKTLLQDAEFLEEAAEKQFPAMNSRADWQRLPPALLPRVLRLWLKQEYGEDSPPSARLCQRFRSALQKGGAGVRIPIGRQKQLYLDQSGLRRYEVIAAPSSIYGWDWRRNPCLQLLESSTFFLAYEAESPLEAPGEVLAQEQFDLTKLPTVLQVRYWQKGDFMIPFGTNFHKKVQDLFTDAHVPREKRFRIPLLLADSDVLWLPTVRRAEYARTHLQCSTLIIQFGHLP
ncbi:MAG: tRNA lysidine(34) synthetase TilS [Lentisphaeria bacterium]